MKKEHKDTPQQNPRTIALQSAGHSKFCAGQAENEVEKKYKKKDKRKKSKMKVSGIGVKSLSRIIKNK